MFTFNSDFRGIKPELNKGLAKEIFQSLCFIIISIVFLGFFMEKVLKEFDDFGYVVPTKVNQLGIKKRMLIFAGRPWYKLEFINQISKNSLNYHAKEFTSRKNIKSRIAVLGDSFVKAFQIPIDKNFVSLAEKKLDRIQLLALGRSGFYLPVQLKVFRHVLPELFGLNGKYAPIDGVVFCMRAYGLSRIAMGDHTYGVTKPKTRSQWQYEIKKNIVTAIQKWIKPGIRSKIHILSYFTNKTHLWLQADLNRMRPKLEDKSLEWAQTILRDEVVLPIVSFAKKNHLPIAFFYLPSKGEVENPSTKRTKTRQLIIDIFKNLKLSYLDATPYLKNNEENYFPNDGHPNKKGHHLMSLALKDLIINEIL